MVSASKVFYPLNLLNCYRFDRAPQSTYQNPASTQSDRFRLSVARQVAPLHTPSLMILQRPCLPAPHTTLRMYVWLLSRFWPNQQAGVGIGIVTSRVFCYQVLLRQCH